MTERQDQASTGNDPVEALARQLAERLAAPSSTDGAADPAVLTALAGHVRSVDEKVEAIGTDVVDLAEAVSGLSDRVGQLAAAPPTALADWLSLGPEEAEERWREIAYWVEHVLVGGYNLSRRQLPDCWPMHRTAMVHLSWLYASYRQAYHPQANPILAAEWSTRWLREGVGALRGDRVAPLPRCRPRLDQPGYHLYDVTQEGRAGATRAETDAAKIAQLQAQRAVSFPTPPVGAPAARPALDPKLEGADEQLAERRWWNDYLRQGREEDLAWRQERAAAGQASAQ